jgi:hypothetical protein
MRRAWILPALALACSRENPGFLLAEAGAEPTTGASSDASTTTATPSTTTATTGEPAPLCPAWLEPSLDLSFVSNGEPLMHPADCSKVEAYRGGGMLSTNTLTIYDGSECGENLDGDFQVKLGYVDFNFPIINTCFEVQVEWAPDCSAVRSVLLLRYAPLFPNDKQWFAAGVVGSASPPPGGPPELTPTLLLDQACSCDPEGSECCPGAGFEGPGSYQLHFPATNVTLGPGQTQDVIINDTTSITLANLRTHVHADCIMSPVHLDWYALRTTI